MEGFVLVGMFCLFLINIALSQVNIMTDEYRIKILNMHNQLRSKEGENATYMIKLAYDYSLEGYAANWGMKCMNGQFQHSPQTWPNRASPGENLYASSVDVSKLSSWDPSNVVKSWWDEREHFNWNLGGPEGGFPVGHWTQVVRAAASTVGCAIIVRCPGPWKTYVICHYDFGNLGYIPYPNFKLDRSLPQKPCSQCPSGYNCCENNLCVGIINPNVSPPGELQIKTEFGICDNYMMRLCNIRNGACPQSCIELDHPAIKKGLIVQQCTCTEKNSDVSPTMAWKYKQWYNRGVCTNAKGADIYSMKSLYESGTAEVGIHDLSFINKNSHKSEFKTKSSNRFSRDLNFYEHEHEVNINTRNGLGLISHISAEQDDNEYTIPTKGNINSTMDTSIVPIYSSKIKIRSLSNGEKEAII